MSKRWEPILEFWVEHSDIPNGKKTVLYDPINNIVSSATVNAMGERESMSARLPDNLRLCRQLEAAPCVPDEVREAWDAIRETLNSAIREDYASQLEIMDAWLDAQEASDG